MLLSVSSLVFYSDARESGVRGRGHAGIVVDSLCSTEGSRSRSAQVASIVESKPALRSTVGPVPVFAESKSARIARVVQ